MRAPTKLRVIQTRAHKNILFFKRDHEKIYIYPNVLMMMTKTTSTMEPQDHAPDGGAPAMKKLGVMPSST